MRKSEQRARRHQTGPTGAGPSLRMRAGTHRRKWRAGARDANTFRRGGRGGGKCRSGREGKGRGGDGDRPGEGETLRLAETPSGLGSPFQVTYPFWGGRAPASMFGTQTPKSAREPWHCLFSSSRTSLRGVHEVKIAGAGLPVLMS
jgi:hypothetical protein